MGSHGTRSWPLVCLRDDHEQINITVLAGHAPGVRAEQDDLVGIEFGDKAPSDLGLKISGQS